MPIIYTTSSCFHCHEVKQFFDDNNVKYSEIDVSNSDEAKQFIFEKTGRMAVPVIQIKDEFIVGFDKEKLQEILQLT